MTSKFTIDKQVLETAKIISSKIETAELRKRTYALSVGALSAAEYLNENGLDAKTKPSLFKVPSFAKNVEIADIYINEIRLDVRVTFNENSFSIPKMHEKYEALPDAYIVVNLGSNLESAQILGFVSPINLDCQKNETEYYTFSTDILEPISELKTFLDSIKLKTMPFSSEENEKIKELTLAFVDNEISESEKIFFIKHVINSAACREVFCEFNEFDSIIKQIKNHKDLLNDSTLSVLTGNKKEYEEAHLLPENEFTEIEESISSAEFLAVSASLTPDTIDVIDIVDVVDVGETVEETDEKNEELSLFEMTDEEKEETILEPQNEITDETLDESVDEITEEPLKEIIEEETFEENIILPIEENPSEETEEIEEIEEINSELTETTLDEFVEPTEESLEELTTFVEEEAQENINELEPEEPTQETEEPLQENLFEEESSALELEDLEALDGIDDFNIEKITESDNELNQETLIEYEPLEESKDEEKETFSLVLEEEELLNEKFESELNNNEPLEIEELQEIEPIVEEPIVEEAIEEIEEEVLEQPFDQKEEDVLPEPIELKDEDDDEAEETIEQETDKENAEEVLLYQPEEGIPFLAEENNYSEAVKEEIEENTETNDDIQGLLDDDLLALLSDEEPSEKASYTQDIQEESETAVHEEYDEQLETSDENIETLFENTSEDENGEEGQSISLKINEDNTQDPSAGAAKKLAIGAALLLLLVGGAGAAWFMNNAKSTDSNADMLNAENKGDSFFEFENKGKNEADAPAISQDINKSMANSFSDKPAAITVTKISWQVSEKLASETSVKEYLQITGKNIQMNLQNDLANSSDVTFNPNIKISFEIAQDNTLKGMQVLESSGSDTIDEAVTRSIKNTLKYVQVPKLKDYKSDYFLTIVINF